MRLIPFAPPEFFSKGSRKLLGIFSSPRHPGNFLFCFLFACELFITIFLILNRRMVMGHDGFQYFTLQYFFANHAAIYGEIPQWIPFMTHGTVATIWYALQAGLLQNALFLFAPFFKDVNFITLFHLGMGLDGLLLLTGTWLLSKRFFSSPFTVFFVAISVMGSSIWSLQPWWNFHLYYAIPLILHFLHVFLETGKWRYAFLGGNLLAVQTLGNLPYFIALTSLVIFLYFLFYALCRHEFFFARLRDLNWGLPAIACIASVTASLAAAFFVLKPGMSEIARFLYRNADGTAPLEVFLSYGGNLDLFKWLELFMRLSFCLDYTLYLGMLVAPLAVLGLVLNLKRENAHFALLTLVIVLFSLGTFASIFFYYSWPAMKFYRHLSLASPVVKLFLCFLAGTGFEAVFILPPASRHVLARRCGLFLSSLAMAWIAVALFHASKHYDSTFLMLTKILTQGLSGFAIQLMPPLLAARLVSASFVALIASLLLALPLWVNLRKHFYPVIFFILCFHAIDAYEYKFFEYFMTTLPLEKTESQVLKFQPMPYPSRRTIGFDMENPRTRILMQKFYSGALYWSYQSFVFADLFWSPFRTDHWLDPIDQYLRAYSGNSINEIFSDPARILDRTKSHPSVKKISGVAEDKVRIFSNAFVLSNAYSGEQDQWIRELITRPEYEGNILFLTLPDQNTGALLPARIWSPYESLSVNAMLSAPPARIRHFSANRLEIDADIPELLQGGWLFYSDAWHPFWKATVNGQPVPVLKANLAYKAVPLKPGPNLVRFRFHSGLLSFLQSIFEMNSLFWVGTILFLTLQLLRERSLSES